MLKITILFLSLTLAGCAAPRPPIKMVSQFNEDEIAWSKGKGTGSLSGAALIQTQGGIPRTCAGRQVGLIPAATYSSERMFALYANQMKGFTRAFMANRVEEPTIQYTQSIRMTTCDAQGNFEFDGLPKGLYYVSTGVVWNMGNSVVSEGGYLMQRVSINDGERTKVVLAP